MTATNPISACIPRVVSGFNPLFMNQLVFGRSSRAVISDALVALDGNHHSIVTGTQRLPSSSVAPSHSSSNPIDTEV